MERIDPVNAFPLEYESKKEKSNDVEVSGKGRLNRAS